VNPKRIKSDHRCGGSAGFSPVFLFLTNRGGILAGINPNAQGLSIQNGYIHFFYDLFLNRLLK